MRAPSCSCRPDHPSALRDWEQEGRTPPHTHTPGDSCSRPPSCDCGPRHLCTLKSPGRSPASPATASSEVPVPTVWSLPAPCTHFYIRAKLRTNPCAVATRPGVRKLRTALSHQLPGSLTPTRLRAPVIMRAKLTRALKVAPAGLQVSLSTN